MLVTLAEFKAQIGSTAVSDDVLQGYLDTAREQIEFLVGPVLTGTVTETLTASATGTLLLSTAPVAEVTALTLSGSALSGYTLRGAAGLILGLPSWATVSVTYSTGRTLVPASIRQAQVIIAKQLMDRDAGSVPTGYGQGSDETLTSYSGFAIPNAAKELLAPYLLGPRVA